jgi:uracil-DNA glycosylase family 4
MPTIVPPCGPTTRPLLAIVGEAPGSDEETYGKPFVGPSGKLLDSILRTVGIDRESCYITNVSKSRPPSNDFGAFYHDPKHTQPTPELLALHQSLAEELSRVQPSLVIALGGEALRALTSKTSIMGYRGTLLYGGAEGRLKVLPSLHPAYLLRGNIHERPVVECDLRKALRIALNPKTRFITDPSFEECLYYLRLPHKRIAYDYETIDNLTWLFGFAWSSTDAISIPFTRGQTHRWSPEQEVELTLALRDLLENPGVEKLVQNGMYDNTISARELGIDVQGVVMDTMLAQHTLYPELLKGLDFLSSIYTDHPMYWDKGRNPEYNCYDCVVTFDVAAQQEVELREREMWEFFQRVPMRALRALCRVQSRGVLIDQKVRAEIRVDAQNRLDELKARLPTLGYPHNPFSPVKLMEHLYGTLKLPVQYKGHGPSKKRTSDDDALQALGRKHPQHKPLLDTILDCRQTNVLISTFIDQELLNGRAVTSYNIAGTVTGRLASSSTIDRLGGNLQNIPRGEFRRIFTADPGCVLIKADLSQAEYRVLIWKARVHRVIDRWTRDPSFNIHRWNASENIYRIPLDQVTPTQYSNAKNGVYGANYNIGALKVSRMYNIPFSDAKFILDRYHQAVPEVRLVFQQEIQDELQRHRKLRNSLGRERYFGGYLTDDTFREAYSWYPQSTVGDLINLALVELVDLGVDVLLQVHDELVCQCPESEVEPIAEKIRCHMERPISIPGVDIPLTIPVEIKVGRDWHNTMSLSKWKEQHAKAT